MLHNLKIAHAQFANFWHKRDPNPYHNANSDPNPNPSQIAQQILQIVRTYKVTQQ